MWQTEAGLLSGCGVDDGGPFIAIDERQTAAWRRHRLRPLGEVLHMRVQDGHFCTGRYDLDRGHGMPCPEQRELPDARFDQCFECRQATGFNPAFYNALEISPQQQRRNAEPHFVYLAHFGCGLLKVGMSYEERGLGRLLEQGARVAAILARCEDAHGARALEALVAQQCGVAETVRSARKRKLLGAPFRSSTAREELMAMVEQVRALRPDLDARPEVVALDAYYGDARLFSRIPVDLSDDAAPEVHGRCLGMVGDILVVDGLGKQVGQHFMCSLGGLKGRGLQLSDRPGENRVPGQTTLRF